MWRDPAWVLDMQRASRQALLYASTLTRDQFLGTPKEQDAILRQLTILGEAVKRVSQEFRDQNPEIAWKRVAGFRDVVVHDYFHVDLEEVWRIVSEDLPALVQQLDRLAAGLDT